MTAYAWVTEHGEQPLTRAEAKEVLRLRARHRDIWDHGAGALAFIAEKEQKQIERQAWVDRHKLSCFKCRATVTEWAAGGRNKWGKLYVICMACVRKPKEKEAGSEATL